MAKSRKVPVMTESYADETLPPVDPPVEPPPPVEPKEIPQDEQDGKLIYDLEKQSTVGHGADVDRILMGQAATRLREILGEEDSVYLPDGKRTTDTPPAS